MINLGASGPLVPDSSFRETAWKWKASNFQYVVIEDSRSMCVVKLYLAWCMNTRHALNEIILAGCSRPKLVIKIECSMLMNLASYNWQGWKFLPRTSRYYPVCVNRWENRQTFLSSVNKLFVFGVVISFTLNPIFCWGAALPGAWNWPFFQWAAIVHHWRINMNSCLTFFRTYETIRILFFSKNLFDSFFFTLENSFRFLLVL